MTKITIAGTSVFGLGNMGDDALLNVLVRELHKNITSLEVTWLARHPDPEVAKFHNIQKISNNFEHNGNKANIGRWFYGLNPNDPPSVLQKMRKILEETDLLIVGGYSYSEITMGFYRGLGPQTALLITLAKFLQKPTMLYSMHIGGKLETPLGEELLRFCVTNATKVTLREAFSENVLKDMGIPTDNCVALSDGVWGLDPMEKGNKMSRHVLAAEGITFANHRLLIGVCFRHEYWHWDDATWSRYRNEIAAGCDQIVEALDAEVLFIPSGTYNLDHYYEDDRNSHREIVERMKHKNRAHQILKYHNLYETLSLFPSLDLHFSNRRHSLFFAAIHGVPIVPCGATWHVKPPMDELGVGDKFLDYRQLDHASMISSIKSIWNDRDRVSSNLQKAVPRLRKLALEHAKVAAELLS